MKRDNETKILLLESAKKEFMEKGYMGASLRSICKNANMTTGALYYFFNDKEELFEAIAGEVVNGLFRILKQHFEKELSEQHKSEESDIEHSVWDDYNVATEAIRHMYANREEILMILTKSQGSSYENVEERFIEMAEMHYRTFADKMSVIYPDVILDDKMIHWLAHMQMDAFIYMITHIENEAEGKVFIERALAYMNSGFLGMYQNGGIKNME